MTNNEKINAMSIEEKTKFLFISMTELKPCPFCGAPAELKQITGRWTAKCTKECVGTRIFKDQQKAVDVWNRRTKNAKI